MNHAAFVVYLGGFLLLPPALLMTRLFDKARMPWVILLGASVLGGWLLANMAYMFYINSQEVRMAATGEWVITRLDLEPEDLDGFPGNDALFKFGGVLGAAYLVPWLCLYCLFVFMRWMLGSWRGVRQH